MKKRKILITGLLIVAAILSALIVSVHYLLPRIINSEIIKDRIQTSFTQYTGGVVEFERLELSILPRPHIMVYQGNAAVPDLAAGAFGRLKVYPEIFQLVAGKLQITKIVISSPRFMIDIHRVPDIDGTAGASFTTAIQKYLTALAAVSPDLAVTIEKGNINIVEDDKALFSFSDLNSKILISPDRINLNISFNADDLRTVSADLEGSVDYLSVEKTDISRTIKIDHLEASIEIQKDRTFIKLGGMNMTAPGLKLSGRLVLDEKENRTELEVTGRDVDVAALRETVLAFAGDQFIVKEICSYLRGGDVPFVEFTSRGSTLHDLYDPELFVIRGAIRNGRVFVKGHDLAIENVEGDVLMKNGILEGSNISSEMDDAIGTKGKIRIGLLGDDPPLFVETNIRADLSRVQPVLERVIDNRRFLEEMGRLHEIKGTASGKFKLGGSYESVSAEVDIDEVNISAEYDRIPYAVKIDSGQFHYDESLIVLKKLKGVIGKSSLSGFNAELGLKKNPQLKIDLAEASIFLDEMYPWLASFENIRAAMKELETLTGTLGIQSMTLDGPFMEPEDWVFQGEGEMRYIKLKTSLFPDIIHINKGGLRFSEKKVSLKNSQIAALDASFNISGEINDYLEGVSKTELGFNGDMGPDAIKWTSAFIKLPPELRVRPPLNFSQGDLSWERNTGTALDAYFTVNKDTEISLDMLKDRSGLVINKLIIEDKESYASLSAGLKDKAYDLHFKGNLMQSTMDHIFLNTQLKNNWLKGDFEAHIMMDQPGESSFTGSLKGKDLIVPWHEEETLTISSISLHGSKNSVRADSLDLAWGDRHFIMKGDLTASGDAFVLDLEISADKIEWGTIRESFQRGPDDETLIDQPVKGALRISADEFRFDRFTFNDVKADIAFNRYNADMTFHGADLCGIHFPGDLKVTSQDLLLNVQPAASNQEMQAAVECLFGIEKYASGNFNLDGNVMAKGHDELMLDSLQGDLSFLSKDGRIYQYGLIAKIFAFINLTEIFRGRPPDLVREGFAYKSITGTADIQGSRLILKEFVIDGSSMQIAAEGDIDMFDRKVDLKVLVAPLKTVDFVIKNIPVIKEIFGGTLVSIPVRVRGDYADPDISYLSPADIGSGLLGILENALKVPGRIIEPLVPDSGEKE